MKPTQPPSAKYPGARKPIAGSYNPPVLKLPGLSNMPKRAVGRKTGNLGSFPKMGKR